MYLDGKEGIISNKYLRWYELMMSKAAARSKLPEGYTEKHHIVPRALGGTNRKSNLVVLSAREHFIAHAFLQRCTKDQAYVGMTYAMHMMLYATNAGSKNRYQPRASIIIACARKRMAVALSKALTGRKNTWTKSIPQHQKDIIAKMNTEREWTTVSRSKSSESAKKRYAVPHVWITNGVNNLRLPVEQIVNYPEWRRGKINRKVRSDRGKTKSRI